MALGKYNGTRLLARFTGLIGLALIVSLPVTWAQKDKSRSRPKPEKHDQVLQPRQFSAIAHDAENGRFLLFGGTDGAKRFDDTWVLSRSGWKVQKSETHPVARTFSAAAYDGDRDEFVLFGGRVQRSGSTRCSPGATPTGLKDEFFCGDTWIFNGQDWIEKHPQRSPSSREGHAMAFDAERKQVVLFGGSDGTNGGALNDTWTWDGRDWQQKHPAHTPPGRFWHSLAYDPVRREVVMFGGDGGDEFLNDTWLWNGDDWKRAPDHGAAPELRTNAGLDYDATLRRMVLFSGSVWNSRKDGLISLDSWTWDGAQWTKLPQGDFHLLTDFSKLKPDQVKNAILANGTPSYIWVPEK